MQAGLWAKWPCLTARLAQEILDAHWLYAELDYKTWAIVNYDATELMAENARLKARIAHLEEQLAWNRL